MDEFGEFDQHLGRIGAGLMQLLHQRQRRGDIALHREFEQVDDMARSDRPSMARMPAALHAALRAMRDRLIEQRQRVAHRAFGDARDQRAARRPRRRRPRPAQISGEMPRHHRPTSMRFRSKRRQRERTVIGTFSISVVANRNLTCSGGSSSVFNRPLKACLESMCTSSMI